MPPVVSPIPPAVPAPVPMPEPAPAAAVNVGVYSSEDELLIRLAPDGMSWQRLAPRAAVQSGERLHAPPTFRPQLILGGNLQATLAGAASVTTLPPGGGVPRLELAQGRLVLVTLGMPGVQLSLAAGGREVLLVFSGADAACAVDFSRYHAPGADPLAAPAHRLVQIYVTSGSVTVTEKGQGPQAVAAGHVLTLQDDEPAKMQPAETLPDWIAARDLTEIDRKAAKALKDELAAERPVTLVLRELVTDRRAEVRSLAVRALGYLGDFEGYVTTLNDMNQRSSWAEQFDALQTCLALSPDFAAKIRQGFEKAAGDDAAALYRLLWGYSPEELRLEEGKKLVDQLDHETMAVRVLAFENLRRITGKTQLYRPEHTAVRRRPAVTKWRETATKEGLSYAKPTATPPRATTEPDTPDAPPVAPLPTIPPPAPAPAKPALPALPGE